MVCEKVEVFGFILWVWIYDVIIVGVDLVIMFIGLIFVMCKLFYCNGMKMDDIDFVEINEVFVLVVCVW